MTTPGSGAAALTDELVEFLRGGVAVVVATRDEELQPEIARGWGMEIDQGAGAVTLCVEVEPGSRTRANMDANGAVAVTCSRPTTYRTVQLKGTALALGKPTEEQLAAVRRHLESFVDEVGAVGVRPEGARSFLGGELLTVKIAIRELYDQTPGAGAGAPL